MEWKLAIVAAIQFLFAYIARRASGQRERRAVLVPSQRV